jgi:FMN phosphatase YigB (HAD superfamily)
MIGVAFALRGTFGRDTGTERAALESVARKLASMRGWVLDETRLHRVLDATAWEFATGHNVAETFFAALGSTLSRELGGVPLEALFRMAGAECVAHHFVPYDDVAPTLRELAALNLPRAVLSGGWSGIDQRKAEAAGFDGPVLIAEDLEVPATSPAAFARIAQTLTLPADRIWFVGTDPLTDIRPAAAVGMKTVWLNRDEVVFPAECDPPNITITSFGALLGALSEPYTRGSLALRYILRTVVAWRPGRVIGSDAPILSDDRPDDVDEK